MKHLGDITKISGYTAPTVDCIIGGSPCQDLSIAGKRAGLDGERSGLFMEQIRIIKEMRERDVRENGRAGVDVRPRYMVWENVPGAFSSNKGEDFRIVLEETAKVADKDAVIPQPDKGKWTTSGCIVGDGWSIAWRVLDAQFWGVPQRRRRIALVADFGGQSAPEILFVRKSVSGHPEQSESKRKEVAIDATGGIGANDPTITVGISQKVIVPKENASVIYSRGYGGSVSLNGITPTLEARSGTGGNNQPIIAFDRSADPGTVCYGISSYHGNEGGIMVVEPVGCDIHNLSLTGDKPCPLTAEGYGSTGTSPKVMIPALACTHGGEPAACYAVDCRNATEDTINGTLQSNAAHSLNGNNVVRNNYIVRRLTPLECERLQGFPDGWTDIGEWTDTNGKVKKTSDAARYKALGNSIAIPPWKWVLKRICACYEREATMASLFDGIGGFPYIWEQINGKGSCLWASEIEEFPIAVTKRRFNNGQEC